MVLSCLFGEVRKSTMTLARKRHSKTTGRTSHREKKKEIKGEEKKEHLCLIDIMSRLQG